MESTKKRAKTYPSFISLDCVTCDEEECGTENEKVHYFNQVLYTESLKRGDEIKTEENICVPESKLQKKLESKGFARLVNHVTVELDEQDVKITKVKSNVRANKQRFLRQAKVELDASQDLKELIKEDSEVVSLPSDVEAGDKTYALNSTDALKNAVKNEDIKTEHHIGTSSPSETKILLVSEKLVPKNRKAPKIFGGNGTGAKTKIDKVTSPGPEGVQKKTIRLGKLKPPKGLEDTVNLENTAHRNKRQENIPSTSTKENSAQERVSKTGQSKNRLSKKISRTGKNRDVHQTDANASSRRRNLEQSKEINETREIAEKRDNFTKPAPSIQSLEQSKENSEAPETAENRDNFTKPGPSIQSEKATGKTRKRRLSRNKKSAPTVDTVLDANEESGGKVNTDVVNKDEVRKENVKRQMSDSKTSKRKKTKDSAEEISELSTNKESSPRNDKRTVSPKLALRSKKKVVTAQEKREALKQIALSCAIVQPTVSEIEVKGKKKRRLQKVSSLDSALHESTSTFGSPLRRNPPARVSQEKLLLENVSSTQSNVTDQPVAEKELDQDSLRKTGAIPKRPRMTGKKAHSVATSSENTSVTPSVRDLTPQRKSINPGLTQRRLVEKRGTCDQLVETPKRVPAAWDAEAILLMVMSAIKQKEDVQGCSVQYMKMYIKGQRGVEVPSNSLKKALEVGLTSKRLVRQGNDQSASLIGKYMLPEENESSNTAGNIEMPEWQSLLRDIPKRGKTTEEIKELEDLSPIKHSQDVREKTESRTSAAKGGRRNVGSRKTPLKRQPLSRTTSTPVFADERILLNTTFVLSPIKECKSDTEYSPKKETTRITKGGRKRSGSDSIFTRKPKALSAAAAVRKKKSK